MTNLGDLAFSPGDMMRRIRNLEETVRMLTSARTLENASIGAGGIRVTDRGVIRSDTFDGDLSSQVLEPGTRGWAIGRDRIAVRGQLLSAVAFSDPAFAQDGAFDLHWQNGMETIIRATIDAPSWAVQAIVLVSCYLQARNPTAQVDTLNLQTRIAGAFSFGSMLEVEPSRLGVLVDNPIKLVDRRIDAIDVELTASTNLSDWTGQDNLTVAHIDALAIFRGAE